MIEKLNYNALDYEIIDKINEIIDRINNVIQVSAKMKELTNEEKIEFLKMLKEGVKCTNY